jgi:hypothetical protein
MEISVNGPADLDTINRLEEEGVSRVTIGSTCIRPDALRSGLETIYRNIIAKF